MASGSMTELEKCMAGELYDCHDPVFIEMKAVATRWMQRYNSLPYEQGRNAMPCSASCSVGDEFYLRIRSQYPGNIRSRAIYAVKKSCERDKNVRKHIIAVSHLPLST